MAEATLTAVPAPDTSQMPTHKWLIAAAMIMGSALEIIDISIVNVSLPFMQGSFAASVDEITWVVTSYLVASGIMIPMTGWISSHFGRKRYFMLSITTFVFASAACGFAQTLDQIVFFRLVQGAAGAAMVPTSQAILMETFPPAEQQLAMALWGIGLQFAPVLAPTIGGWITDNLNWRWNFFLNIPIGLITLALVTAFVYDPAYLTAQRGSKGRVDYTGIACLAIGFGLLEVVLARGQRSDWFAAPWVCYFVVISISALVLMVVWELRAPDPIVDLRILKLPQFRWAALLGTVNLCVMMIMLLLNPVFLQELMGYPAWRAGLILGPRGISTLIGMLTVARLSRRGYDTRPLLWVAFAIIAYSTWMMGRWDLQIGAWAVIEATLVHGLGSGMAFPILSSSAISCVGRERMGFAASLYNTLRNTSSGLSIAAVSNMLVSHEQIHQANLVTHFSVFDAWRMSQRAPRMPGTPTFHYMPEMVTGQKTGLDLIYKTIQGQAAMMSFNDIFMTLTAIVVLVSPAIFLLMRVKRESAATPALEAIEG